MDRPGIDDLSLTPADRERLTQALDEARAVVTKLNDINEGLLTQIDQLTRERDEAREVARRAVAAWHWHQEAGHPPALGYDEPVIQQLYAGHPWLKEESSF